MTKDLQLPQKPTLRDFQKYVKDMVEQRGFSDEKPEEIFVLLVEELGELARTVRQSQGIKIADDTKRSDMEHEFADCFIYLLHLANYYGIDLEKAFRNKEEKNKKRKWK